MSRTKSNRVKKAMHRGRSRRVKDMLGSCLPRGQRVGRRGKIIQAHNPRLTAIGDAFSEWVRAQSQPPGLDKEGNVSLRVDSLVGNSDVLSRSSLHPAILNDPEIERPQLEEETSPSPVQRSSPVSDANPLPALSLQSAVFDLQQDGLPGGDDRDPPFIDSAEPHSAMQDQSAAGLRGLDGFPLTPLDLDHPAPFMSQGYPLSATPGPIVQGGMPLPIGQLDGVEAFLLPGGQPNHLSPVSRPPTPGVLPHGAIDHPYTVDPPTHAPAAHCFGFDFASSDFPDQLALIPLGFGFQTSPFAQELTVLHEFGIFDDFFEGGFGIIEAQGDFGIGFGLLEDTFDDMVGAPDDSIAPGFGLLLLPTQAGTMFVVPGNPFEELFRILDEPFDFGLELTEETSEEALRFLHEFDFEAYAKGGQITGQTSSLWPSQGAEDAAAFALAWDYIHGNFQ